MPADHDQQARVEAACAELAAAGQPVTFGQVAARTSISRTTLYRRPDLRAVIDEHRARGRDATTLTGLAVQIDRCAAASKPSPPTSAATKNSSAASNAPAASPASNPPSRKLSTR